MSVCDPDSPSYDPVEVLHDLHKRVGDLITHQRQCPPADKILVSAEIEELGRIEHQLSDIHFCAVDRRRDP